MPSQIASIKTRSSRQGAKRRGDSSLSARFAWEISCATALLLLFFVTSVSAQTPPKRPRITGIAYVHFYSTNMSQARSFYAKTLDPSVACVMCEDQANKPFRINFASGQHVLVGPMLSDNPTNLLRDIEFITDDIDAMRIYLKAHKIKMIGPKGDKSQICVLDPEGHRIWFRPPLDRTVPNAASLPLRIIHAGFIVKDRAAEDTFYKDLLGFRPYWHGGMKDDETTWVSLQVPDGTDWLEYMLYDDAKADKNFRGVMNHFAVGVVDIQAEAESLTKNGWNLTEEPKLGRDGKWQLNVYDPDHTRVEFMEFTPKEKPCCSEFTAPHPKP